MKGNGKKRKVIAIKMKDEKKKEAVVFSSNIRDMVLSDLQMDENLTYNFALSLLLLLALSFLSLIRFEIAVPRSNRFRLSY